MKTKIKKKEIQEPKEKKLFGIEEALEDIKNGRVTKHKSVDSFFLQLNKEKKVSTQSQKLLNDYSKSIPSVVKQAKSKKKGKSLQKLIDEL